MSLEHYWLKKIQHADKCNALSALNTQTVSHNVIKSPVCESFCHMIGSALHSAWEVAAIGACHSCFYWKFFLANFSSLDSTQLTPTKFQQLDHNFFFFNSSHLARAWIRE